MFFDNWGKYVLSWEDQNRLKIRDNYSRILEIDPISQEVVWSYSGNRKNSFYSKCCGMVQRLPNGNTLIIETSTGRAFEVTPNGETAWEFKNPNRAATNRENIAAIFSMKRIPKSYTEGWLNQETVNSNE
jgi:hypothetical protein